MTTRERPEYHREHARRTQVRIRAKRIAVVRAAKDKPCSDCGGVFHYCAMQFDHVRGEKKFQLSSAAKFTIKQILDEIAKCDLVCANCHALRTWKRGMASWLKPVDSST